MYSLYINKKCWNVLLYMNKYIKYNNQYENLNNILIYYYYYNTISNLFMLYNLI